MLAALLLALTSAQPAHSTQRLDLGLLSEEWEVSRKGPFSVGTDRRGVLTMTHADVPAEIGSHATVSRYVTLPEPPGGPLVLRFYLTDDYCGNKEQRVYFRDGVGEVVSDWKEGVRFAQVLLGEKVVWSKDVLGRNGTTPGSRFYDLELSDLVGKESEFELSFRVQDEMSTEEGETFWAQVFWARAELIWDYGKQPPPVEFPPPLPFRREKFRATDAAPPVGTVSLTLRDPSGAEVPAWPVRWGVPLPKGAISEATQVALRDAAGEAVPLQTRVLVRWPDDSIKWLLLDFLAPLSAADATYTLAYGSDLSGAADAEPAGEEEPPGQLQALVPRFWIEANAPVEQLSGAAAVGYRPLTVGPLRQEHLARVEYRAEGGAVVATAEIIYDYCAIYRNTMPPSFVRHTLQVTGEPGGLALRRAGIDMGNRAGPRLVGIAGEALAGSGGDWSLTQRSESELFVGDALENEVTEAHWDGWITTDHEFLTALRWPWQQSPTGIRVDEDGQTDLLLLTLPDDVQPLALAPGEAKTHELMLKGASGMSPEEISALNAVFQRPPVVVIDPEYLAATGALGPFMPRDERRFPQYESRAGAVAQGIASARETQRAYGYEDFGDTQFGWGWGEQLTYWSNTEYDHAHALLWQFLRSGDPELFTQGTYAAMHYRDVDIVHANDEHPDWLGGAHHHSETHTGHAPSISHHWTEGIFDHWLLTGDSRSLECGLLAADYAERIALDHGYGGGERDAGWNLIALMGAYRATGETRYLDAATKKVEEVLTYFDPVRGVSSRPIFEQSAYEGGVPFMAAVLMRGLTAYYDETHDERVGWAICGMCDWMALEMMPAPGRYSYKQAPTLRSASPQLLALDGAAFAWAFTGSHTYRRQALDVYAQGVGHTGLTNMRDMPHALAYYSTALLPVAITEVRRPLLVSIDRDEQPVASFSLRNVSGEDEMVQVSVTAVEGDREEVRAEVDVPPGAGGVEVDVPLPLETGAHRAQRFRYKITCRGDEIRSAEFAVLVVREGPRVLLLASEDCLTTRALSLLGIEHTRVEMAAFDPAQLADVDVVICGFDTDRAPLAPHAGALAEWLDGGGVLLGFREQSGHNAWLPSPVKQDACYQPGAITEPEHPAFSLLHAVDASALAAVHGGSMYRAFYDLGDGWTPLASAGAQQAWDQTEAQSAGPHYGLVELRHGEGRVVLCQLIPEYAWLNDDSGSHDSPGRALLENLLGYVCLAGGK